MEKITVFLTGFMGSGKSAAGKRAASILKYNFFDTDKMVEEALGRTIPDIFGKEGEDFFRYAERKALEDAVYHAPCIVSTGGGAICHGDNLKFMKSEGFLISLLASPETIFKRISVSGTVRPLLSCPDPKGRIEAMLQKRAYYYIGADVLIDTENKSVADVATEVVKTVEGMRIKLKHSAHI